MRTCIDGWRSVTVIATVGALAFSIVAFGAPDKKGVTRGPISVSEGLVAVDPNSPVMTHFDDAAMRRGGVASVPVAGAPVYLQADTCFYGYFLTDDDTSGLGGWWGQARFTCPPGYPSCKETGWQAGDAISGYEVKHFFCSSASANACTVEIELWDGDPLGAMDTVCNPAPAAIAGTKTTFSGLSRAVYHNLKAQLETPVVYNCDRVWIVVSLVEGCRGSWLWGGSAYASCFDAPADIGWGDGVGVVYGCQQLGACATPSSYNAGTCCTNGQECDYTDADPNNWTGDCQEGGVWPPECPSHCLGYFTHPTFCSDGVADYYNYWSNAPLYYNAQPGAVYAATDIYMSWTPVSAGGPPPGSGTFTISGNEITLGAGGTQVWMEIRITDMDPLNSPNVQKIMAFQCNLTTDGYYAGLQGTLTPYAPACTMGAVPDECEALMGSLGHPWGGAKGGCGATGWPDGECIPAWIDNSRTDYIFYMLAETGAIDVSTPNFRYGATTNALDSPDYETYAGTLTLDVSADAMGTFWVGIDPLPSGVSDQINVPLPMMGFVPGVITVASSCCLPNGSCVVGSSEFCEANDGMVVPQCLGDGDGNGRDDACDVAIPPGEDCWRTECGATKFSFCDHPIPADFFAPGSEPFDGVISLGGSGEGDFDTSMRRLGSMVLPEPDTSDWAQIELTHLSLVSCDPIEVQIDGGPTQWNVSVGLSNVDPPRGRLDATKTHTNGGTFTAQFYVQPTFTFTRVGPPYDVVQLDTGAEGMPPMRLKTVGSSPWVHKLSDGSTVFTCGENFAPGVEEDPVTLEQCCRKVGHAGPGHIHETGPPDCSSCPSGACCDPADGSCEVVQTIDNCVGEYKGDGTDCTDTDQDGIPDLMESSDCCVPTSDACNTATDPNDSDSDDDGCLDGEEITGATDPCDRCDFLVSCVVVEHDCNSNGAEDECDVEEGTSEDCQPNGIPDECEPGACCGTSVTTGTGACAVAANKAQCEALTPPGVFLGPCEECPPQNAGIAYHGSDLIIHTVGDPVECPDGKKRSRECDPADPKIDPWKSKEADDQNPAICHNFGAAGEAIPGDFFGEGSLAFAGSVCLAGVPLGPTQWGEYGDADTLIARTDDPFDRCALPSTTEVTVEIEIVALSLAGVEPITVNFDDLHTEDWSVEVSLSAWGQQAGSLTAIKTHCNGGKYSATYLPVQPKFTFTKVGDPGQTRELDRGDPILGRDPVPFVMPDLDSPDAAPWVHDVGPNLGMAIDVCSDFHPGIEDAEPTTDCDCQTESEPGYGARDKCDIESATSQDCNGNGIPDECDVGNGTSQDCQPNDIPDECELTDNDCNNNNIPDECDVGVGGGSEDCTGNGIPDECEPDCNDNGVADSCDIDADTSQDCNANYIPDDCEPDCNDNGVADSCDLTGGTSHDFDGNGLPDECDCTASSAAEPELLDLPSGPISQKIRYLSFTAGDPGQLQAVRVTFQNLPPPHDVFNGSIMWVGEPREVCENSGDGPSVLPDDCGPAPGLPSRTFMAAKLTCDPYFTDWSVYDTVHVYHQSIVPGGTFVIRVVDQGCALNLPSSHSDPLTMTMSVWGDVVRNCITNPCWPPDGSVDVPTDVTAVLDKFRNLEGAPRKARCDLEPSEPDRVINIADVTLVLDAFRGFDYPFEPGPPPPPCP